VLDASALASLVHGCGPTEDPTSLPLFEDSTALPRHDALPRVSCPRRGEVSFEQSAMAPSACAATPLQHSGRTRSAGLSIRWVLDGCRRLNSARKKGKYVQGFFVIT
jgi:hypothetical protein